METWSPLRAHAEWMVLLREALYGGTTLTPAVAGDDRGCAFGCWLAENEERLGPLSEYQAVMTVHAAFHRRAAYCLELAHARWRSQALAETADGGELRRLSRLLVRSFLALQQHATTGDGKCRTPREIHAPTPWAAADEAYEPSAVG